MNQLRPRNTSKAKLTNLVHTLPNAFTWGLPPSVALVIALRCTDLAGFMLPLLVLQAGANSASKAGIAPLLEKLRISGSCQRLD